MATHLRHILEMIRFSHTLFALPFSLLAAAMAWSTPAPTVQGQGGATGDMLAGFHWRHLLGILICMVCARSAAMAFNRIADRQIDAANPRTSSRHLVTGVLPVRLAGWFTLASAAGFVGGTLLFWPNPLPLALSVPILVFLLGYSYAKRFTLMAHFWLGASLMLAPVATWIALRGAVLMRDPADILPALLLGSAVLLWVAGFDIVYACQDVQYDRRARLRSLPAAVGVVAALRLAAVCHAGMILVLMILPWTCPQLQLGWIYGLGVALVAALLVYEHVLVRPDDLTRVNLAFFHVNAVVSLGLFAIGTLDLLI